MAWIITKDLINPKGDPFNRIGFGRGNMAAVTLATPSNAEKFRLLDDDQIPIYEGIRTPDDDSCFDWGMADAGCTELQIRNGRKWETVIG